MRKDIHLHFLRRGIAPLEMVMILPFLVFLFCLILYVCASCIQSSEHIVKTRNEIWQERFDEKGDNHFNWFNARHFGKIEKKESAAIKTGFYFDSLELKTTAEFTLITGTWDTPHEQTHIYRDLTKGVLASGLANEIKGLLNDAEDWLEDAQKELENALNNLKDSVAQWIAELIEIPVGTIEKILELINGTTEKIQAKFDEQIQEMNKKIAQLKKENEQLQATVDKIKKELDQEDIPQKYIDIITSTDPKNFIKGVEEFLKSIDSQSKNIFEHIKNIQRYTKNLLTNPKDAIEDIVKELQKIPEDERTQNMVNLLKFLKEKDNLDKIINARKAATQIAANEGKINVLQEGIKGANNAKAKLP